MGGHDNVRPFVFGYSKKSIIFAETITKLKTHHL